MHTQTLDQWRHDIIIEAEVTAMRLQGLAYLAEAWGNFRDAVGDPGPENENLVMHTFGWALRGLAEGLTPPEPSTPEPPSGNGRAPLAAVPSGDGRA